MPVKNKTMQSLYCQGATEWRCQALVISLFYLLCPQETVLWTRKYTIVPEIPRKKAKQESQSLILHHLRSALHTGGHHPDVFFCLVGKGCVRCKCPFWGDKGGKWLHSCVSHARWRFTYQKYLWQRSLIPSGSTNPWNQAHVTATLTQCCYETKLNEAATLKGLKADSCESGSNLFLMKCITTKKIKYCKYFQLTAAFWSKRSPARKSCWVACQCMTNLH